MDTKRSVAIGTWKNLYGHGAGHSKDYPKSGRGNMIPGTGKPKGAAH